MRERLTGFVFPCPTRNPVEHFWFPARTGITAILIVDMIGGQFKPPFSHFAGQIDKPKA
ncbi:hypothetical protein PROAA_190030 [Candidatus Propionivibrio aalborgensis]|uniref:Uncharacterized protein n=1 Tax=Candidatus Propionivibrio aalborgensis TaxID=1860101 RepID=A0A1A8XPF9_9RHOO|nr:hypothetical protein PROAA_190030 [Candidatus Propionivibrio aalborgensis]